MGLRSAFYLSKIKFLAVRTTFFINLEVVSKPQVVFEGKASCGLKAELHEVVHVST